MEKNNHKFLFLVVILLIGVLFGLKSSSIKAVDQTGSAITKSTSLKTNEDPAGKPYCKWDEDGGLWFCTCANHHIGSITWGGWHDPVSSYEWRACSAKSPY